jgi:hypothetical protein
VVGHADAIGNAIASESSIAARMVLAFAFDKAGNVIEVHDRRGDPIMRGICGLKEQRK